MKENHQSITTFHRNDFRKWLESNHKNEKKVAVILHKRHTGKSTPTHRELMEEAICFGWIDTTIKRLDENTYLRYFARRNEKSKWSDNTLSYAKELLKKGVMQKKEFDSTISENNDQHMTQAFQRIQICLKS